MNIKKILFLILLIFFINKPVFSQVAPSIPLPGVNCGDSNGATPDIKKCCYNAPFQPKLLDFPKPLDVISGLINSQIGVFLNPLLTGQRQVTVEPCVSGSRPSTPGDFGNAGCTCVPAKEEPLTVLKKLCDAVNPKEQASCLSCIMGGGEGGAVGVWTGMGCIYTNMGTFIQKTVFGTAIGLAGGVSLLCIIYAAFIMQTSRGNPEKLKKSQELLTSCIMGLMLILFSVFILKLIGVDILKIPGFK